MLSRLIRVIGAAVLVITSGTSAFAQISNPKHTYETIKASTITNLFAEVGIASTVAQMEDGTVMILVNVASGKVLVLGLDTCGGPQGGGCKEMAMVAVDPSVGLPYATALENLVLMNLVNKDFDFGQYFFDHDDNIPMAARFEVFEYGVSKGNLFWNIASMINYSNSFFTLLAEIKAEKDAGQTTGFAAPGSGDTPAVAALYASIKPKQQGGGDLPGIFGSGPFRTLLKSKSFAQDVSWTINPGDELPAVFLQHPEE